MDVDGFVDRLGDASPVATVVFDRDDSDSFRLAITHHAPGLNEIQKSSLFPLLPQGSTWRHAAGWYSLVGIPFTYGHRSWIAVGVEQIVTHPDRGAYPSATLKLFPRDSGPSATNVAHLMIERGQQAQAHRQPSQPCIDRSTKFSWTTLVWRSNARRPEEHLGEEAEVLRIAAGRIENGSSIAFRTAILSATQLPRAHEAYGDRLARYWGSVIGQSQSGTDTLDCTYEYFVGALPKAVWLTLSPRERLRYRTAIGRMPAS